MSAPGKSPSVRRVAVTVSATCLLALAVTPVSAAPRKSREAAAKKEPRAPSPQVRAGNGGGGHTGPLSLEWRAGESFRP
jgi:hypothetical protein